MSVRVQGSVSIRAARNANIWLHADRVIKTLNLNVSRTKRYVVPKQKPDRFPSIGDHIHVTPTLEHAWKAPRYTAVGGS